MNRPVACLVPALAIGLLGIGIGAPRAGAQQFLSSPVADEVMYQIMPIAWRDSNNDTNRFGDFGGLTASLDYLQSLGITGVWINPIFPSVAYHGYHHGQADLVDSDFGTQQQFLDFVTAAKARGIKVYLDFVVYGVATNTVYYTNSFNNPASIYDTWMAYTNAANTQYSGTSYTTWNGSSVNFIEWDLRTAACRDQVTAWARKWLDPNNDGVPDDGIAGYRFDHCLVNNDHGPGGWGYNLDTFWTPFFASLRQLKPDVFLFGEQADWGTRGTEFLSQFDAMFTMPLMFAERSAFLNESASGLISEAEASYAAASTLTRGTFLGIVNNHDNNRLASTIGADTAGTIDKGRPAAASLLLGPFTPVIYYGDEIGMKGVKGNWGSDANDCPMREPFKWLTNAGAPMSNYFVLNSSAYNNRYERNADGRSVQEQQGVNGSLLETYRTLIALRKNNAALRRGTYSTVPSSDGRVWSFVRRYSPVGGPTQTLLVTINLSSASLTTNLNLGGFTLPQGGSTVTDLQTGATLSNITGATQAAYPVPLTRYQYRVFTVDLTPPAPPVNRVDGVDILNSLAGAQLNTVQDTPTNVGDNTAELDRLMVREESDGLLIGIPGNLGSGAGNLAILIDSAAGGQIYLDTSNQVPPPNGLAQLTGTIFDTGFAPGHMFFLNVSGSNLYCDQLALAPGSCVKTYRGTSIVNSGSGLLSGGVPNAGVQAALNNTNTSGVTASSAANAALATTGLEMFVPYSVLGLGAPPCGTLKVAAFISRSTGSITNQFLPGLQGRTSDIGIATDLTTISGTQHATVAAPPSCTPPCPADINGSGAIDTADLTVLLGFFGSSVTPGTNGDVNGDGSVNTTDLTLLLAGFGTACP